MATTVKEYDLKISTKQAQANIDELNKSLELQETLIEDIEKELREYQKDLNKTSATDLARRKDLNDKIKQTKERLTDEKIALKQVNKDRKKANEVMKEAEENAADYSGALGLIDQKTGGVISGFKGLKEGIGGVNKGFKTMRGAIIATGIGALVLVLSSLAAAFTSSEEGQNKWSKALGMVGAVVGAFTDKLADLGLLLIDVFTNPLDSLKSFGQSIQNFVMDKVAKVTEGLGLMGSAISKVFSGDFSGAFEDATAGVVALNRGLNPVVIVTESLVEGTKKLVSSTKSLVKEMLEEAKIAGQIADQRAKADKLDRQIIVDRAKANRDRADLLEKAVDKEKFTVEERIQFLKDAGALEDEITNKEITAAQLRLDAKVAENALGKSTKEDLEEEANLRANLINLETAKLTKAKEVTSQIIALNAEAKMIQDQADADEKQKILDLDALKKQIRDAEAVTEDERRALEIQKTIEHYDELIRLAKEQGLATEQLEKAKNNALSKYNKDNAENSVKWEDMTAKEKLGIASTTLGNMATILGEESAAGKAMAIGQATISTFQSAQDSYKSMAGIPVIGPVLGGIAAAAAVVSGMAQVKAIQQTKLPTLAGKTPPSVSSSVPSAPAQATPPSFNIVGASDTNQLADVIGQQEQQPVQAFVVASEVTTAQALERNTVEGATIG